MSFLRGGSAPFRTSPRDGAGKAGARTVRRQTRGGSPVSRIVHVAESAGLGGRRSPSADARYALATMIERPTGVYHELLEGGR